MVYFYSKRPPLSEICIQYVVYFYGERPPLSEICYSISLLLLIYLPLTKKFCIALDKANWSQPTMEKSYIYIKA